LEEQKKVEDSQPEVEGQLGEDEDTKPTEPAPLSLKGNKMTWMNKDPYDRTDDKMIFCDISKKGITLSNWFCHSEEGEDYSLEEAVKLSNKQNGVTKEEKEDSEGMY
jgi:hypothetical protein